MATGPCLRCGQPINWAGLHDCLAPVTAATDTNTVFEWLMRRASQSHQVTAERLTEDFTLTPKPSSKGDPS